jgi:hypothetical protein
MCHIAAPRIFHRRVHPLPLPALMCGIEACVSAPGRRSGRSVLADPKAKARIAEPYRSRLRCRDHKRSLAFAPGFGARARPPPTAGSWPATNEAGSANPFPIPFSQLGRRAACGQGSCAGGDHDSALGAAARPADDRRFRARLRGQRFRRAPQHARRDRREAQPGDQRRSLLRCERFPVLLHREFPWQGIELPCRLEPKNAAEGPESAKIPC